MLLAQKAYVEGGLALGLYCSKLVDDQHTGTGRGRPDRADTAAGRADPDRQELAVPVVPGRQRPGDPGARRLRLRPRLPGRAVLPGQPAEPDPRGHPRHPGPRPARPQGRRCTAGPACALLAETIVATIDRAENAEPAAKAHSAADCAAARSTGWSRSPRRCTATGDPELRLANASTSTSRRPGTSWSAGCGWSSCWPPATGTEPFYQGKRRAAEYFHRWELPKTGPMFDLLAGLDRTVLDTRRTASDGVQSIAPGGHRIGWELSGLWPRFCRAWLM